MRPPRHLVPGTGPRTHSPAGECGIWWCFAVGVFGNCTGILVEGYLNWLNPGFAFPSWADLLYLSLYPAVALGLAMLIRKRTAQRDWGTLVDATTVTAGLGLLAWIFMIRTSWSPAPTPGCTPPGRAATTGSRRPSRPPVAP